jgi:hypothetical protein
MIEYSVGILGEFRIEVKDSNGNITKQTDWQKNLITDKGLDGIALSSFCAKCGVGSGNNAPDNSQTALQIPVAVSATTHTGIGGWGFTSSRVIIDELNKQMRRFFEFTYHFPKGSIPNKNISELGLCSNHWDYAANTHSPNLTYNTRALIKDSHGNPTTISIRADEELFVYYRLWAIYSLEKKEFILECPTMSGSTELSKKSYKLVVQVERSQDNPHAPFAPPKHDDHYRGNMYIGEVHTVNGLGSWVLDPAKPAGTPALYIGAGLKDYINGSCYVELEGTVPANQFHRNKDPAEIKALVFFCNQGAFLADIYDTEDESKGIPKTNQYEFTFAFRIKWKRYDGDLSIIKEN